MITVKNLKKSFGELEVLKDISMSVEEGEVVSIIGPSGSGKSTLLRCATMLETMNGGDLLYGGTAAVKNGTYASKEQLAKIKEFYGLVFQNFNLFDHMKAIDNVTYALRKVKKMNAEEARAKGLSLLEKVGLRHRADAYPHQLSGGEKQRCAIARALAMEPDVLLFDEPTSALDPEMTGEVLKVLQDLNHTGITMIVVTHEMNFAKKVADYVIYMDKGNIEECSKAAEFFEEPKTARAKEFLSKMI